MLFRSTTDSSGSLQIGILRNIYGEITSILQSSYDSSVGDNNNNKGYNNLSLQPNGGNLGIGSNHPLAIFDIKNNLLIDSTIGSLTNITHNAYEDILYTYRNIYDGPASQIQLAGGKDSNAFISFRLSDSGITSNTPLNSDATLTEAMRIIQNGNIGIGTDNPVRKLHVTMNNSNPIARFERTDTSVYVQISGHGGQGVISSSEDIVLSAGNTGAVNEIGRAHV